MYYPKLFITCFAIGIILIGCEKGNSVMEANPASLNTDVKSNNQISSEPVTYTLTSIVDEEAIEVFDNIFDEAPFANLAMTFNPSEGSHTITVLSGLNEPMSPTPAQMLRCRSSDRQTALNCWNTILQGVNPPTEGCLVTVHLVGGGTVTEIYDDKCCALPAHRLPANVDPC